MTAVDKVYVINLKEEKERLFNFKKEINKIGKSASVIEGIRGSDLTQQEKKDNTTFFCRNFCTDSLIGCALSHKEAWMKAKEDNCNYAMICEDDCYFTDDFRNKFDEIFPLVPKDFDILFVGCEVGCSYSQDYSFFSKLMFLFKQKKFKVISEHVYIPEFALAAHCYIVSRKGLEKILKSVDKIYYHIDFQLNTTPDLSIYAIEPKLAFQDVSIFTTSNVNHVYPSALNKLFDNIKDKDNRPYSYILSISIINISLFNLCGWSIIFFILGLILGRLKINLKTIAIVFFLLNLPEMYYYPEHFVQAIGNFIVMLVGWRLSNNQLIHSFMSF